MDSSQIGELHLQRFVRFAATERVAKTPQCQEPQHTWTTGPPAIIPQPTSTKGQRLGLLFSCHPCVPYAQMSFKGDHYHQPSQLLGGDPQYQAEGPVPPHQLVGSDPPHQLVGPDPPHPGGARSVAATAEARSTTPTGGARFTTPTGKVHLVDWGCSARKQSCFLMWDWWSHRRLRAQ